MVATLLIILYSHIVISLIWLIILSIEYLFNWSGFARKLFQKGKSSHDIENISKVYTLLYFLSNLVYFSGSYFSGDKHSHFGLWLIIILLLCFLVRKMITVIQLKLN